VTKTIIIYVKLFDDFACQKLSKLTNFLRSYFKNKNGTVFETWYMFMFFMLQHFLG